MHDGEKVAVIRTARRIVQKDIAAKTGMTQQWLSRFERTGKVNPFWLWNGTGVNETDMAEAIGGTGQ